MSFGRPTIEERQRQRAAEREGNLRALATASTKPLRRGVYAPVDEVVRAEPREPQPIRSEAYLRLVAARPCIHCGVEGFSQAAHPPASARGKKEDDRLTFPLCGPRPGIPGCHAEFDQMRLLPGHARRGQALAWAGKTRRAIERAGTWPASLPKWTGGDA